MPQVYSYWSGRENKCQQQAACYPVRLHKLVSFLLQQHCDAKTKEQTCGRPPRKTTVAILPRPSLVPPPLTAWPRQDTAELQHLQVSLTSEYRLCNKPAAILRLQDSRQQ
ncbi:uncharacterized protein LOC108932979 isoform X2 [Scleropages formosus]|uniref:uncharacterized protein LOC108932979 isoform X2 n=1 Tax=Scleropages formosus TaxID=113540 RepID=UPI00087893B4|nr:uncharacterized protein LOC108932979 isoform X2 [Scleropages formosus]